MKPMPQKLACYLSRLQDDAMDIAGFRGELEKTIEDSDQRLGKFQAILEFLAPIISNDKQRYEAAVKALTTASELNLKDVLESAGNQLNELKNIEDEFLTALSSSVELEAIGSSLREIEEKRLKLLEELGRLDRQEQEILDNKAGLEKETGPAKRALEEVFVDIRNKITGTKTKLEEFFAAERQEHSDAVAAGLPGEGKDTGADVAQKNETSAVRDKKWQKKCPKCKSKMNFFLNDKKWSCNVCSYEEFKGSAASVKSEKPSDSTSDVPKGSQEFASEAPSDTVNISIQDEEKAPGEGPVKNEEISSLSNNIRQRECPNCGSTNFFLAGDKWLCDLCAHEELENPEVSGGTEPASLASEVPQEAASDVQGPSEAAAFSFEHDNHGHGEDVVKVEETSSSDEEKQRECPNCGSTNFFLTGDRWFCNLCAYEELENPDAASKAELADPFPGSYGGLSTGGQDPSGAFDTAAQDEWKEKTPGGEAVIKEETSPSGSNKWIKKCPNCGSKMNFFLRWNKWLCNVCAYEELKNPDASGKAEPADSRSKTSKLVTGFSPEPITVSIPPATAPPEFSVINPVRPVKKKNCPVCKSNMDWCEADKTWRCSSCDYHRMEF